MAQVAHVEIELPKRLSSGTIAQVLEPMITKDHEPRYKRIRLDMTKVIFVEPVGVTSLSNAIEWLKQNGCSVGLVVSAGDSANRAQRWLDEAKFFEHYMHEPLDQDVQCRSSLLPLSRVTSEEFVDWKENKFNPWIANQLRVKPNRVAGFTFFLDEIVRNIQDHSGYNLACVCGQYYPSKRQISIAISDFGVGIPTTVNEYLDSPLTDYNALKKAMEKGFSVKTTPRNRGFGLSTLVSDVVHTHKGSLAVVSGRGRIFIGLSGKESVIAGQTTEYPYPGTLFDIVINAHHFKLSEPDEIEEELWLS
ncbi:MAG: hypothetical protein IH951_12540 [Bacteroidetes bacterium]|nr:hypothetical protein [Bacteroidota bacterium]